MADIYDQLNDLEQKIFRQTSTTEDFCDSVLSLLEQSDVNSATLDSVSNLLIGLKAQSDVFASKSSDLINEVIRLGSGCETRGTLLVDGNGTITLPKQVTDVLGWVPDDILKWKILPNGSVSVSKDEKYAM